MVKCIGIKLKERAAMSEESNVMKQRHSLSHIMAAAIKNLYSDTTTVRFGVGPAIENGFYYDVDFGANIAVPTGETVGEISVAFALDGNTLAGTEMVVTPAAVEEYFNVSRDTNVSIWKGCCQTLSIRNTSTIPILVENANVTFEKK